VNKDYYYGYCPSVRPSVSYRLLSRKQECVEKNVQTFRRAGVTCVPILSSKRQRSGLEWELELGSSIRGRPHSMSALGRHSFRCKYKREKNISHGIKPLYFRILQGRYTYTVIDFSLYICVYLSCLLCHLCLFMFFNYLNYLQINDDKDHYLANTPTHKPKPD